MSPALRDPPSGRWGEIAESRRAGTDLSWESDCVIHGRASTSLFSDGAVEIRECGGLRVFSTDDVIDYSQGQVVLWGSPLLIVRFRIWIRGFGGGYASGYRLRAG